MTLQPEARFSIWSDKLRTQNQLLSQGSILLARMIY